MIQEQFWLNNQLQPESPAYNIPSVFKISGQLDISALEQSINQVIDRHESLRMTFASKQGLFERTIALHTFLKVERTNLSHLSREKRLKKQQQVISTEITRPFNLSTGPLIRSHVIQSGEHEFILIIVMHHIITDLASKKIFAAELSAFYNAITTDSPLPELATPVQYSTYVSWQEQWSRSQDAAAMLQFWKDDLREQNQRLNLPLDYPRPPVVTSLGKAQWFQLNNSRTTQLHEFSRQQSVAPFIILLSSYIALLSRYCRQREITIGVPLSNRRRENDKKIFGCFVNILPLTLQLSNGMSFTGLLALVRKKLLQAHRHQESSFDEIVAALQPTRDASYNPIFQAGFTLEPPMELQFNKLQVHSVQTHNQGAQLDLFLTFREITPSVQGYFEYNQDLFSPETIERLSSHYQNFLSTLLNTPDKPLNSIEFLTTEEKNKLLLEWNDTRKGYGPPLCLHRLFEQQVEKTPNAVALITEQKQYSYKELNQKANRVAHYLQDHGIGPDDIVAVFMQRSAEMVIALYGIIKAGAAYVPLEPELPDQRLSFILSETKVKVVLTQASLLNRLPEENTINLCLDTEWHKLKSQTPENPSSRVTPDNLAYIIYTSGSTGTPKGVMIEHKAIYNRLMWMQDTFQLTPHDRILQKTPFSFDVSVWEFFWPLFTGASLVVAPVNAHKDPLKLSEFIKSGNITTIHFVPSMLRLFLDTGKAGECTSLRQVICSGEALSWELQNSFFKQCTCGLHNLYGPTEAAIDVSYWQCRKEQNNKKVPIGFPIANTQLYILDSRLKPVAQGTTGELYIGGIQVARGYLQRPELNAATFLPDPFSKDSNARLYKTGDLARHLPDGAIDYLGRVDFQVKLHGNRVELDEIEAVLNRHPHIKETVVTLHTTPHGKQHLVAYLLSDETDQAELQLRSYLANALPDYMIPGQFILLPEFPLTGSGKVNRKMLPDPEQHRTANERIDQTAPGDLTLQIMERWKQVLERTEISIHDNFFDIGGNSLLATQLTLDLEHDFQVEIPLVKVFQHPTIAAQSAYLTDTLNNTELKGHEQKGPGRSSEIHKHNPADEKIAVIGMAGRFPDAANISEFWQNIANGKESLTTYTDEELLAAGEAPGTIRDPNYVKTGTILTNAKTFDAAFFDLSPKEALYTNPQHRLFLETCWEALENSGYRADNYPGAIGVFGGTSNNGYSELLAVQADNQCQPTDRFQIMMGNDPDFLTTRVAYKLNLKGPALTIQTACSTSLVAIHQACQSLLNNQCDMALSGGVCVHLHQGRGYFYQEGMIFSPDGHCRAFDANAQGTVFGQGAGVVVLKRLSEAQADRDTILAVISGSAVNNDGAMKVGITAPGVEGQTEVIAMAQAAAGVKAEEISYIETHGTGTPLGDPIEVEALTRAFRRTTDKNAFCAIGSVKTNIGHLDAAAGVTGLMKTTLALYNKHIPPSLNFSSPNPNINFTDSPFYVNTTLQTWPAQEQPRRAAVSSFGIGGTNAHVIMEEAPKPPPATTDSSWQLLPLSARSDSALAAMAVRLAEHLTNTPEQGLPDIAHTLQVGRKPFAHRCFAVSASKHDAGKIFINMPGDRQHTGQSQEPPPDIVFMFSGQGAQYVNMTRDLYENEPFYAGQLDYCADLLQAELGLDIRTILFPEKEQQGEAEKQLKQTNITQPALFIIEYCLAKLWIHWGIKPSALVGHSIGEYVAACLAEVFSLEDTLRLVAARGRLMHSLPSGAMLAIALSAKEVTAYLTPDLSLAVINGAKRCVVSGTQKHLDILKTQLDENTVNCQFIQTSHAFHSHLMEPILDEFRTIAGNVQRNQPQIPFVSNVSGTWITDEETSSPDYWASHLRQPVQFFSCLQTLLTTPHRILLEVGPGQTLAFLSKQHPDKNKKHHILASTRRQAEQKDDQQVILQSLGQLWLIGVEINWHHLHRNKNRSRIPLPTYPFERKKYWPEKSSAATLRENNPHPTPDSALKTPVPKSGLRSIQEQSPESTANTADIIADTWKKILVGVETIEKEDNFFDLGGDSLQAIQMLSELEKETGVQLPLTSIYDDPVLSDFAQLVQFAGDQQVSENISSASCSPTATGSTGKTLTPWRAFKKIIQLVGKPVSAFHFAKKLLLGTYCILWYRLFSKNVRIKFPFFAYTKITITGPGTVFIDSGCTTAINSIDHPTIVTLHRDSVIRIGKDCSLAGMTIRCRDTITIGDRTWLPGALIQDFLFYSDPEMTLNDTIINDLPVTIGNDVWLAMQSAILPGSSVGNGSVLGVQAVLYNASVDNHCFAYGNPIKKVVAINQ